MTLKLSKLLLWLPCFMAVILFAVAGSAVAAVWVSEQAAPVQVFYDAPANECDAATGPTAHTEAPNDVYDVAVDLGVGMMDSRVPLVWQEVPRGTAHSAANRPRLQQQLASEQQVGELASGGGQSIAGAGGRVPIRDVDGEAVEVPAQWVEADPTAKGPPIG